MYSSIHSLAHRAPATRPRVRWQPYGSLPPNSASLSTTNTRSPSSTCANSPISSAPSSPISTPQCEAEPPKLQQTPQQLQQQQQVPRDAQTRDKNKYALGLVDQAVKSLCEIWRPQDIPKVFLTNSRAAVPIPGSDLRHSHSSAIHNNRNSQLPSIQTPPPSLFATGLPPDGNSLVGSSNLVPMKGFVHEVLRRSRTSGSVLQTALCYLEAIRPRISELAQLGEAYEGETELAERITVATEAELAREAEFNIGTDTIIINESEDSMDTVRISDSYSGSTAVCSGIIEDSESTLKKLKTPSPVLPTLPSLPSPLLCPRRAFLASLILASKFTQDKCYSNRAWAKLSGLPAREVGRCERALGDALDWRLWVGKSSQGNASPAVSTSKPLARCRSESSIPSSPAESTGFLSGTDKRPTQTPTTVSPPSFQSPRTGLRRAATLPTEAFAFNKSNSASRDRAVAQWVYNGNDVLSKLSDLDDQSIDMVMYSPDTPKAVSSANTDGYIGDSSPAMPGLSYSPSSTESSSGDRTIQMPCFFDDKNVSIMDGSTSTASLLGISSETWPWLDHSPPGSTTIASLGSIGFQDFTLAQVGQSKSRPGFARDAFGNVNVWSPDLLLSRPESSIFEHAILIGSGSRV